MMFIFFFFQVSGLKRKINSLSKELLENECTISELREEVQTLEVSLNSSSIYILLPFKELLLNLLIRI